MKIAVIGSRTITSAKHYQQLVSELDALAIAEGEAITEIISGGCLASPDEMAERYARERGIPTRIFLPDYATYGRRAPLVRNQAIVGAASIVLAFWDGKSPGTAHALRMARRQPGGPRLIMVIPQP